MFNRSADGGKFTYIPQRLAPTDASLKLPEYTLLKPLKRICNILQSNYITYV